MLDYREYMVPELIPVLGSQPAGDVSHKPGSRLPLLSARPTVTLATLKRAATRFGMGQLGAANSATGQFGAGPTRRGRFGAGTFRRIVSNGDIKIMNEVH